QEQLQDKELHGGADDVLTSSVVKDDDELQQVEDEYKKGDDEDDGVSRPPPVSVSRGLQFPLKSKSREEDGDATPGIVRLADETSLGFL
ncbi:unnamed protein product, partial [Amoebophrya sp. A25]